MRLRLAFFLTLFFLLIFVTNSPGKQLVTAGHVDQGPVIDGMGDDPVWAEVQDTVTYDEVAGVEISLKALYTDEKIFFKVVFPDPDESRIHKPWTWNKDLRIYRIGPEREDTFVFKWNMDSDEKDLSVYSDNPYTADIWFWKACRSDPSGYADDKIQVLSETELSKSMKLTSKNSNTFFLKRTGDKGRPANEIMIIGEYEGDKVPQYKNRRPDGSRADIEAKGLWHNGKWTIEFSRKLNTGNDDDLQFDPRERYLFGLSRYEIAGRKPDHRLTQPLHGSGDTSEMLYLQFSNQINHPGKE